MTQYEPRGGARELLLARDATVLISGPAGTGKSVAALQKIHITSLLVPGLVTLLLRQTAVSLGPSTLRTYERFVAAQELASENVVWYGGSSSKPAGYMYKNGSLIIPGGMDKPGKFLSMDVDRVLIDEANQVSVTAVETVATRLRGKAPTYKQMMLLTNPDHPDHHLLKMAEEGRARHIHSVHADNPYLFGRDGSVTPAGADYIERLKALTGVRRERYFEGRWVAAEGAVYENWSMADNVIEWFETPRDKFRMIWSVDFGFSNPFSWQEWAVDHDGRMYLMREIHKTQTLVEDHAREILRLTGGYRPEAIICDHDSEDRATLERHLKMPTIPARKGVSRGIQLMHARIRKAGDGRPRLFVVRNAVQGRDDVADAQKRPRGLAAEVLGYVWETVRGDDGIPKEVPVKLNDHSMDAARYAVAYLDWHNEAKVGNPAKPSETQTSNGSAWSRPIGKPK
jgi:hypothetical protein